jgi:ADP-ribose pyrophosphatase YjhB (NUDIX family)
MIGGSVNNRPVTARRAPSFTLRIPEGDVRERRVCDECGFIDYVNPKVVVGAVCRWEERLLLCRRGIEPRRGYWTVPAGFLEEGETVEEGVRREAHEEARAELALEGVLGIYSIPRISQVHIMFRARLLSPEVRAGEETTEVALVPWAEVPWDDLAFPSVRWALRHFEAVRDRDVFPPFTNPAGERGDPPF